MTPASDFNTTPLSLDTLVRIISYLILSLDTLVRIISYLINGIKTPPHSPRFTLLEIARQYPCEISQLNGEMYFHFSSIHNLSFLENDGGCAPSHHSSIVPGPAHSDSSSCSSKLRSDPKFPLLENSFLYCSYT